jgi:Spy/CpxP family protein refolding chaperone
VICAGVALALGATRSAVAGPPDSPPWWHSPSIRAQLALTPEQATRLDTIYRESLPARRRLREELTRLQNLMGRVLDDGRFDEEHSRAIVERVFEAEKQRNIARMMMLLRMHRVLTLEQRGRLERLSASPSSSRPPSQPR